MRVRVAVFANLKDYFQAELELDLPDGARAGDVARELERMEPEARELLESCRLAVDENFVDPDFGLKGDEEILVFPPSSGG